MPWRGFVVALVVAFEFASVAGDAKDTQVANEALACVKGNCAMSKTTLPFSVCVAANCKIPLVKCVFDSTCRSMVFCLHGCLSPVASTPDKLAFAGMATCMQIHCAGYSRGSACAGLHCKLPAAKYALHSKCRKAMMCAIDCPPGHVRTAHLLGSADVHEIHV